MSNEPGILSKARLQQLRSLLRKKERIASGLFLIEGWTSVGESLRAGWSLEVVVVHEASARDTVRLAVLDRAKTSGAKIFSASQEQVQKISATEHNQGILAAAKMRPVVFDALEKARPGLVLCLDAVTDPGNVGTLLRSADWFGAAAVLLGKGCVSMYNEKVVRASMGSLFHLPIVEEVDLASVVQSFRESGYYAVGADAKARSSYEKLAWRRPLLVVLGNEARGLSSDVDAVLDERIAIPRVGKAESLNVAIAGSIILSRVALRS